MASIDNRSPNVFDSTDTRSNNPTTPPMAQTPPDQMPIIPPFLPGRTGSLPPEPPPAAENRPQAGTSTTGLIRAFPAPQSEEMPGTSNRLPVVIRGTMKKPLPPVLPPAHIHAQHRMALNLVGVMMLFFILVLTFFTVTPLGQDLAQQFNPLLSHNSLVRSLGSNPGNLIAQATATAVFHQHNDGYDPSAGGGQTITNGAGSLNWPFGQCTFWANLQYHRLTGFWVSWSGNANQWVDGARKAGWNVSQQPHVPSIIVLMAGVQGASSYGHVAVVESMVNSTTVRTSNMNWYANGGGWGIKSYQNFNVGPGVYFIWHS